MVAIPDGDALSGEALVQPHEAELRQRPGQGPGRRPGDPVLEREGFPHQGCRPIVVEVAGVAPRDFDTPHGGDFWFSQQLDKDDINHFFDGFMRLKPGATLAGANAEMAPIMAGLGRDFPQADLNRAYVTKPLVASVVGDLGPILIIVMSATGLLLLLGCVNVASLLLARAAGRQREMAVRAAIGASRGAIIRKLLTESVLLAVIVAPVGVIGGVVGARALLALSPGDLPRGADLAEASLAGTLLDWRMLVFAGAPFTVATYSIGTGKDRAATRRFAAKISARFAATMRWRTSLKRAFLR